MTKQQSQVRLMNDYSVDTGCCFHTHMKWSEHKSLFFFLMFFFFLSFFFDFSHKFLLYSLPDSFVATGSVCFFLFWFLFTLMGQLHGVLRFFAVLRGLFVFYLPIAANTIKGQQFLPIVIITSVCPCVFFSSVLFGWIEVVNICSFFIRRFFSFVVVVFGGKKTVVISLY